MRSDRTNLDVWQNSEANARLCACLSPSLRVTEEPGRIQFDLTCALVMQVLSTAREKGEEDEEYSCEWNGRIHMSDEEKKDLLTVIEASSGSAMHRDKQLTFREIEACIKRKENRTFILHDLPESVAALANVKYVESCFNHRDKDGSGKLDEEEWVDFLQDLEYLHHAYLLNNAFQEFRAFFGLGQNYFRNAEGTSSSSTELDYQTLVTITRGGSDGSLLSTRNMSADEGAREVELPVQTRFQIGLDPEWRSCWKDFIFFSANNHPIHGIFSCSPDHPFSWKERLVVEAVTVMFTFCAIWLAEMNSDIHFVNYLGIKVIATVPGVVLWWVLFLLFVCPKFGIINEASSTEEHRAQAGKWRCVGASVGYVIAMCVLICVGVLAACGRKYIDPGANTVVVVFGRVRGYFVFWFLQTFVYFNPLVAWGEPDTTPSAFGYLGGLTGLGQWRIERQRLQWICAKALKGWAARQHREQLLKEANLWMKPRDVVWEYEHRGGYKPYDDDCVEFIEHRYQRFAEGGPRSAKVFTGGFSFVIDFEKMAQSGAQKSRAVRRRLRNSAGPDPASLA